MHKKIIFSSCLFAILSLKISLSQSSYLVSHYSRHQYAAGSQNWSVDMDNNGFVYVANNNGLMVYDGVKWRLYPLPSRTIVRSVAAGSDGLIYTGSHEDFGYWKKNASQKLEYRSLTPLLKDFKFHNQEIWKIIQNGNKIYFQGFSSLFVYEKNAVKSIQLPGNIIFLLKAGNRMFVQAVHGILYELKDDRFVSIGNTEILKGTEVKTILPYKNGQFLIGTSSRGVFVYDGNTIFPWDTESNPLLTENHINNGIIFGDKIVFGTIVKGLFILDYEGRVINHLHSENDLGNNTVLSLCNDNNKSIWAGLDNGIDNISFNSPVDLYPARNGELGAVYTAALFKDILYVGTNRGIFSYRKTGKRFAYEGFLKNSQGQVWQLKVIDNELFCGHTNGTYRIENNSLQLISDVSGGFMLKKIFLHDKEILIQSTYTSLVIYTKIGSSWKYSHQISGFIEPSRYIEADNLGNIWVGHSVKGLYRLRLSASLDSITEKHIYGSKDGLPSDYNIRVYKIMNRVVFSTGDGLYTWDDLEQKIIPYTNFETKIPGFEKALPVSRVDENSYWFVTKTEAALFQFDNNEPILQYRLILPQYKVSLVDGYENIVPLDEDQHFICLDNGFAIYNKSNPSSAPAKSPVLVFREFISYNSDNNERLIDSADESPSLNNSYNNILISFSSQKDPCAPRIFQYMLEGIDTGWSNWTENNQVQYTRLPVGKYKFKVRTLTHNGGTTEPLFIEFKVRPAWYASVVATLIYIILIIGGILLSQYLYRRRILIHHENLRNQADKKRLAEKENAEQEIIKLQNEKLQAEISHKNMQLADSTISIIRKNEVLIGIKEELEKQKEELGPRYPARYLQRLTTMIDTNISNDNDWEIFEALFDQAHENFFKRLKQSFPDLTQSDLKLCAYLKLNLSSKEIAPLLNISIRGVEIRRYRLRKRLALSGDDNLAEYIMQF